ncbi:MAG TPA: cytochrome c [Candidatus Baltobacteraceae bacterium]
MSSRIVAVAFALLAAAGATVGCAGHHARAGAASRADGVAGADLGKGKAVYAAQCAACHGARGIGGQVGPSLQKENTRRTYRGVYDIVLDPQPPMPKLYPSRMTRGDVRDVSAYVESL